MLRVITSSQRIKILYALELQLIGGTDLCLHMRTYFVVLWRIVDWSECR